MTRGEGGFSGPPKKGDVIYERPLITINLNLLSFVDFYISLEVEPESLVPQEVPLGGNSHRVS